MTLGAKPSRIVPALAFFLFCSGLIIAPYTSLLLDVFNCFLPWARASRGRLPWAIYVARPDCNYPSLWLYVLTAVERVRILLGAGVDSRTAVVLLKLPSLAALCIGPLACDYALRRWSSIGGGGAVATARASAIALALCAGLWIDAAVWGQADVPLCLFLAAAAWGLTQERPIVAGVFCGLAFALKLQTVIALPFLFIYAIRRLGVKSTVTATLCAALVVVALSAPFFAASPVAGRSLVLSYTGAVGIYQTRTSDAFNIWHLSLGFDRLVRHLTPAVANADNIRYVGPITPKQIGIALFVLVYSPLVWRLWRVPTQKMLFLGVAAGYLTFFMLCTEMHERYILPAVAFLAIAYGFSNTARRFYPAFNITTVFNLLMTYRYTNQFALGLLDKESALELGLFRYVSVFVAIAQVTMFVSLVRAFHNDKGADEPYTG